MYTATITNKVIANGKLTVSVAFENETGEKFNDTFETTQEQDGGWITDQIANRLKNINSLPDMNETIAIGPVVEAPKTDGEVYKDKADQYLKFMNLARQGFIASDYPTILTLRDWLKKNFQDEYVDLF